MIELLGRLAPALTRTQVIVILVLAGAALALAVASVVVEGLLTRVIDLALRLSGHAPPTRSRMRVALDALENRKPAGRR